MDDLISRQAAIDAIRASTQKYTGFMEMEMYTDDDAVEAILNLPSAQPEIIRCKDCKHQEKFFKKDGRRKDGGYYIYGCYLAEEYSHVCLDDDYCSRAERKEGKHETY